jgi:hypothetical protein
VVFLVLGWQGITTAGRQFPDDSHEYVLNAQYLREHGTLPPDYVSYEYSAPPLYEAIAIGADRVARSLPSALLESRSNTLNRLLWLALVVCSTWLLTSTRRVFRLAGIGAAGIAALWGLDEAVSLAKTEMWSSGQLVSLAAAAGLVGTAVLIAREVWPEHPARWLGTGGFMLAYPVLLRLGMLFHPETLAAFLGSVAVLFTLRASRRGWTITAGVIAGSSCGLALTTRQSAVIVLVGLVIGAALFGSRRARPFVLGLLVAVTLVGGPWLGYAAVKWGNPLQGNLRQPGSMLDHGEASSFYVSFPFPALVTAPVAHRLDNQFLPQLHADLWSDYFRQLDAPSGNRSTLRQVTASTQSALGLLADALAIGGLAAVGIPALVRGIRRRPDPPTDIAYGILALIAAAGLVGLAAQVIRYPQALGLEIKASYLLFAAPGWAVFSVAAWSALARRSRASRVLLVAGAAAYVLSYGTTLAAAFVQTFHPPLRVVEPESYVDLGVSIQNTTPASPGTVGSEQDFTFFVANKGTATSVAPVLTVVLDPGLRLLGPPYTERGPGCTGTTTIVCPLVSLRDGVSTPIRLGVQLVGSGRESVRVAVTGQGEDATPADNRASYVMNVAPR